MTSSRAKPAVHTNPPEALTSASHSKADSRAARPRWRRRAAVATVLVVAGYLFHGPILRGAAVFLIVEDHRPPATAILILDGDQRFDITARRVMDSTDTVLLFRSFPDRLERLGVLPSAFEISRRELIKRNVSEGHLQLVTEGFVGRAEVPARLCDWMRDHPGRQVDVLCDRFSTRKWKLLFRRAADNELLAGVRLIALPDRRFDETNWWRSKSGMLALLNGYLSLMFHHLNDGERPIWTECTEADFKVAFVGASLP